LWEQLINKAKEEFMGENMSGFLRKILRQYVGNGFQEQVENPRVKELLVERDQILNEERDLVDSLRDLLRKSSKEKKPIDFDKKQKIVLNYITHHRSKMSEISEFTGVSKDDVVVILGNLIEDKKIARDPNWKYYRLTE
jgi:hypothetical protein